MTQKELQGNIQEIRGTLFLKFIETADHITKTADGISLLTHTGHYDWYIQPYPDFNGDMIDRVPDQNIIRPEPIRLEKGDLLTVFNEVAVADILLHKTLELAPQDLCANHETSMTKKQWNSLFHWELPAHALLNANPETGLPPRSVLGRLFIDLPQGASKGIMCLLEDAKGYEGLHYLKSGDTLVVLTNVRDGKKLFETTLDFKENIPSYKNGELLSPYPRIPLNVEPRTYLSAFGDKMPALIKRAPKP